MSEHGSTAPPASDATRLTPGRIEQLRAEARRESRAFVDPAALAHITRSSFYGSWASVIIGRDFPGVRGLDNWEIAVISLALKAEPDRPEPAAVQERRERARAELEAAEQARVAAHKADLDGWHALRERLPVPVIVGHNQTIGHWESGHVAAGDHIVVQEALSVGRLHRALRSALCETPAKKRSGGRRNPDPLRGLVRDDDGQDRIPTCTACLRIAERVADQTNEVGA